MSGAITPQQLPLVLPHEEALGIDDYLVSSSNQVAFNLINNWPEWPSPIVLLAGPIGSGKTHLVNVWQEMSGATVVKASDLQRCDVNSLSESGPVAVEDIHQGFDERSLFHLFNAVRLHGSSMLITSRVWPQSMPLQLPDLASRFRATTPVEIEEPDDMLLKMVLTKLFADRQISIDSTVVDFLVVRIERSLNAAAQMVDRLDRQALASGKKITRVMASRMLESLDE
ncbi:MULTISPECIES: HdaA/DnaA family protein [Pseudovibrio]|uniref:HdaA/DnaA family protein n=1 Tax=Stappiaceae TaxID=2821832 RepID=UPI0023655154|nr:MULTISPECIES: DnaA/Hda family protein [Pseudovibrio]MDD7908887.1 DnaA/Hda family protein [Pseudovibrio exalbescens]MDX5593792.1 DnaA/Hda family protein [Pseudovibrio sp. SPO723]